MQTTCSIYRATHDPDAAAEVMLDYGDEMAAELDLPESQNVQP